MIIDNAPVVKWISQRSSEPLFWVRVLAGAQFLKQRHMANILSFGIILDQLRD